MFVITTADKNYEIMLYDNTVNIDYSLSFIGYGYQDEKIPNGQRINQNFALLLNHFSSYNPPSNPINGQIWYNSNSESLNLFDEQWGLVYLQKDIEKSGFLNELFLTETEIINYGYVTPNYLVAQNYASVSNTTGYVTISQLISFDYVNAQVLDLTIANLSETFVKISATSDLVSNFQLESHYYISEQQLELMGFVTHVVLSSYITQNQEIIFSGDILGSGKTEIYTELTQTGVNPGTYNQVLIEENGRVQNFQHMTNAFITEILGYEPSSFVNSSRLSQKGYQQFPNGLVIQWMYGNDDTADNTSSIQTVNWSKPFPNAYLGANISTNLMDQSLGSDLWYEIISANKNNVVVKRVNNSTNNTTITFPFIIGFGY